MTCTSVECLTNCPGWVTALAVIGGMLLYVGIAASIYRLILFIFGKDYDELTEAQQTVTILASVLFPLVPVFLIVWIIFEWICLPITAARKKDLVALESRVVAKIESSCSKEVTNDDSEDLGIEFLDVFKPKFKVGDLVTGVPGNPNGYKHLYEGCICRVLSIDDKGSMSLILLDHKDKYAHEGSIGKTFKAPERNFVLIKPKRKTAKKR